MPLTVADMSRLKRAMENISAASVTLYAIDLDAESMELTRLLTRLQAKFDAALDEELTARPLRYVIDPEVIDDGV